MADLSISRVGTYYLGTSGESYRNYLSHAAMTKDIVGSVERGAAANVAATAIATRQISGAINEQGAAIARHITANTAVLEQGFSGLLQQGAETNARLYSIESGLGSIRADFNQGMAQLNDTFTRVGAAICDRLDAIDEKLSNPVLMQSRELYRRAATNYNKGFFEEAVEDLRKALDIYKTDYLSWFLLGKVYLFGAGEFSCVMDLDKSIAALESAAKYIKPDAAGHGEARLTAAEILFFLALARQTKARDAAVSAKTAEDPALLTNARTAYTQSFEYSNGMLESLYNAARCDILLGDNGAALDKLRTLIIADRIYALKPLSDPDFVPVYDGIDKLIASMKAETYAALRKAFDALDQGKKNLEANSGPLPSAIAGWIAALPAPTEQSPYFDIRDVIENLAPFMATSAALAELYVIDNLKKTLEALSVPLPSEIEQQIAALSVLLVAQEPYLDTTPFLAIKKALEKILTWRRQNGRVIPREGAVHGERVHSMVFSSEGSFALSCSASTVRQWDLSTGRQIRELPKFSNSAVFSPDGRFVLSSTVDAMKLWDVNTGNEIRTFPKQINLRYTAINSDGNFVLSSNKENTTVHLWDVSTGKEIRTFLLKSTQGSLSFYKGAEQTEVKKVAFSPDGRFALAITEFKASNGSYYLEMSLWDINTGELIHSKSCSEGNRKTPDVYSVVFSLDGRFVLLSTGDEIQMWDVSDVKYCYKTHTFSGYTGIARSAVFSPDGRFVLSGSGSEMTLWDVSTRMGMGRAIHTFSVDADVYSVAFSPDGRFALTGSGGKSSNEHGEMRLWELDEVERQWQEEELKRLDALFPSQKNSEGVTLTGYTGGEGQVEVDVPNEIRGIPVTEIGSGVFTFSDNGVKQVHIPASVTVINEGAFAGTASRMSVTIEAGVRLTDSSFPTGFADVYNRNGKKAGYYSYGLKKSLFGKKWEMYKG
ncbi:hypothetical protein LQZ19_15780 [Treponema primitia]|uniref:hypothetical protein n=1 Tax=Treponema primitia TaxID=88058 RepID=UPI00397F8F21